MRPAFFAAGAAVLAAGALSFALFTPRAPTTAAQPLPPVAAERSGISVVGEGAVTVTPSTALILFGVNVFDASLAKAQQQAAQQMDAVIARLKASGIAEQDIKTVNYSVNPEYDFRDGGSPTLRGYRVINTVQVKVRRIDTVGQLIDDVVAAGATQVQGISFEAENPEALKSQARELAMANARAKAEQMANLAGVTLGRPILIEESDTGGVPPRPVPFAEAAPAAQRTPIQPGETEVRTTVHVVYSIG